MNPLMITGGLGEHVDAGLVDGHPVAVAEVVAHRAQKIVGGCEDGGHAAETLSALPTIAARPCLPPQNDAGRTPGVT